jgi:chaperone required for assembly of F1-ATPase
MEVNQMKTDKNGNLVKAKSWHKIIDESFFGRNTSSTGFFAFAWDGTTIDSPSKPPLVVPDGQYQVTIAVVKALADLDNPAHTELWTSPLITIDRP